MKLNVREATFALLLAKEVRATVEAEATDEDFNDNWKRISEVAEDLRLHLPEISDELFWHSVGVIVHRLSEGTDIAIAVEKAISSSAERFTLDIGGKN